MERTRISSGSSFEENIGYSRAMVAGDMIFVSGTTGFNYDTMVIHESVEEQTEQCIQNIRQALAACESSLEEIVRVLYILPDASEFSSCWPILRKYFGNIRPAATMIEAGLADKRMKIEIEVTAIRKR